MLGGSSQLLSLVWSVGDIIQSWNFTASHLNVALPQFITRGPALEFIDLNGGCSCSCPFYPVGHPSHF